MVHQKIVGRLREAVLQRADSVNRIAEKAGVPQQVLQRFVAGTRQNLRLDTAIRLMSVLGFVIVDAAPIRSSLREINAQIERWESIRKQYGVALPKEFDQAIVDFREINRRLKEALSD